MVLSSLVKEDMLDSSKYHEANGLQRTHALETLLEYAPKMLWREDGLDTVLDIGCADGTVTGEVLGPLLPKDYKALIGIDSNEEFIKLALKRNANQKITYKTMDIAGDSTLNLGKFDHITSFLCLHWVDNKRKAFENIYNLLADGGDCLLTIASNYSCHKAMKIMSLMDQWKHCFKDFTKSFNPFANRLNEVEYEKYIDDFLEVIWMLQNDPLKEPISRGDSITIYAQK